MQESTCTVKAIESSFRCEKKKKKIGYFFSTLKALALKNQIQKQFYKNERAGILFSTVGILGVMWMSILFSLGFRLEMQNKTATLYRLEFCSRNILEKRLSTLKKLQLANQYMLPLRQVLYALRVASMVPGAQAPSIATERILLQALRLLSKYQDKVIEIAAWQERLLLYCKKDPYSKSLGICKFPPVQKKNFIRKRALFPDIPGPLHSKSPKTVFLQSKCFSVNNKKFLSRSMFLKGDPSLKEDRFEVFYGKAI